MARPYLPVITLLALLSSAAPATAATGDYSRLMALVTRAAVACPVSPSPTRWPQQEGWEKISGSQRTTCALGGPFSFWVHRGDAKKLMIFFQGGGACWTARTCDVEGHPTFDPSVDSTDDPSKGRGIFSLENPDNPVRDYTIVFVPYCSADTFLGDTTMSFVADSDSKRAGQTFSIRFNGARNADDAMQWAYAHVTDPSIVFVTGSSAGAIPSPFFAAQAAQHWKGARVVALGDAGGGYRAPNLRGQLARFGIKRVLDRLKTFKAADSVSHSDLYILSAKESPGVTFAQYNAVDDSTQLGFQRLLGVKGPLVESLSANLREIHDAVPGFRSYTAPGFVHTILPRPLFYRLTVDGVTFSAWLSQLLGGKPVNDVGDDLLSNSKQ